MGVELVYTHRISNIATKCVGVNIIQNPNIECMSNVF